MNNSAQEKINHTGGKNGYIVNTRAGKPSFVLPDVARKMTGAQKATFEPVEEVKPKTEEESKEAVMAELKTLLSKKTHGYSKEAKLEFLFNHCEVNAFSEIEALSEWGLKCMIEKITEIN